MDRPPAATHPRVPVRAGTRLERPQVKEIVAETLHDRIDLIIYDEAASLIEEHHTAVGRDVVIASTSGTEVVEPIGDSPGADRVVATRMVVGDDGCFTVEAEYYAYGPTKARRSRSWPSPRGPPTPLLRLQRLGDRPADAGRRSATPMR
ncbi:hypothetical protein SALBM311S_10679 [Streptomyces alboniger]